MESPRGGREEAAGLGQAGAVGGERKGQEITPGSSGPGEGKMLRCKHCAVNVETPRAAATAGPAHPALRPSRLLRLPVAGLRPPQILPPPPPAPRPLRTSTWVCPDPSPTAPHPRWDPYPPSLLHSGEVGCCGRPRDAGDEGPRLREYFASRHPLPHLPWGQPKLLLECWAVGFGPCPPTMSERGHSWSGAGSCLHINHRELWGFFLAFHSWGAHPRAPTHPPRMLAMLLPAPTSCCPLA